MACAGCTRSGTYLVPQDRGYVSFRGRSSVSRVVHGIRTESQGWLVSFIRTLVIAFTGPPRNILLRRLISPTNRLRVFRRVSSSLQPTEFLRISGCEHDRAYRAKIDTPCFRGLPLLSETRVQFLFSTLPNPDARVFNRVEITFCYESRFV